MKLIIIILFFILIILSVSIRLDIEKIEVINRKIRYRAKVKIYIFKFIKIYQKQIRKKDLKKIVRLIGNRKIIKRKNIKMLNPRITELYANIDYGVKDVFLNVYLYGLVNSIIPMFIAKNGIAKENRNYDIQTNFNSNYFKAKLKMKMEIRVRDVLLKHERLF